VHSLWLIAKAYIAIWIAIMILDSWVSLLGGLEQRIWLLSLLLRWYSITFICMLVLIHIPCQHSVNGKAKIILWLYIQELVVTQGQALIISELFQTLLYMIYWLVNNSYSITLHLLNLRILPWLICKSMITLWDMQMEGICIIDTS
jgi:hypothetical protein